MPLAVGMVAFVPSIISYGLLEISPDPSEKDIQSRSLRRPMNGKERFAFFWRFKYVFQKC